MIDLGRVARRALTATGGIALLLLAGCDPSTLTFTVTSPADAPDAAPGDGVCETTTPGQCTLRAAVMEANAHAGHDTIALGAGQTYALTIAGRDEDAAATGDLDVTDDLRIAGNGATIDANDLDRVLDVRGGVLRVEDATVTGGRALGSSGGGMRIEPGATGHVLRSHVTGNQSEITQATGPVGPNGFEGGFACGWPDSAPELGGCWGEGGGGGIWSRGTLFLGDSAVTANTASGGTCISVLVTPMSWGTVCSWSEGGGVFSSGGAILNSTIAGNTVSRGAGAGLAGSGTVIAGTIAGNALTTEYGETSPRGVQIEGDLELQASVVDGGGPLCGGGVASQGFNVAADASCGLDQPTDRPSHDPQLDPLGDHGGPTPTMPPRSTSPARDIAPAGSPLVCDGTLAADQRGEPRPDGAACDAGAVEGPGAGPAVALALVVNHGGDAVDASPGDGTCQDAGGAPGDCSLRAAIDEANAWGAVDTITIAPGVDPTLTRPGAGEDANQTGDLDVTDPVTLVGGGAVLDAAGLDRALHLHGAIVQVGHLTVTGGATTGDGGGIRQDGGTLTLGHSTIAGNVAAQGGGLARTSGSATLTNVTVSGNVATAAQGGGLHHTGGTLALTYVTVHDNTAASAPAVHGIGGTITAQGSIFSGVGGDCVADVTSLGHNLGTDATCDLDEPTDHPSTSVLLGPLADNGGDTETHLPADGSAGADAIAAGAAGLCDGTVTDDQRGTARPDGAACDIGAVEGHGGTPVTPLVLVVTHAGDALDAAPGDGICQDAGGAPDDCSLRAAVQEANAWPAADTVMIAAGVDPVLSLAGAGDDANLSGDIDVTDALTIQGAGATVDAAGLDRVVDLRGAPLTVSDLLITGGAVAGPGGGIRADGALTATGVTVVGNSASATTGAGGGILQVSGALELVASTIEGNHAHDGGALGAGPAASVTVRRSTLASNTAASRGGAVWIDSGATVHLVASTVSGNDAAEAGALYASGPAGSATIESSTVVDNDNDEFWSAIGGTTAGVQVTASILDNRDPNCSGAVTSGGWNVASDLTCQLAGATDQEGVEPEVGPLADNGGPTRTHLPFAGSPVLDTVPAGTAQRCDGTDPTDQRGMARPAGAACDSGAVEGDSGVPLVALSLTVNHAGDDVDAAPGDGTCQDTGGAPGACSLRAAIDEANAWPAADTVTIGAGIDPVLGRAGAGEDANSTGDLDVLDPVTIDGGGATIDAAGLDRVLHLDAHAVELADVTVTGGDAGGGDGGGVLSVGGSLTVADATITANTARDGGGLWQSSPFASGAALTVTGSTVSSNQASRDGGGIFRIGSEDGTIVDSTIVGNTAGARGGGTLLAVRTHLLRVTVDANTAATGGGVAVIDGSTLPSPLIEDSTVSGNTATVAGGGIAAVGQNGRFATFDVTVSGNQAPEGGGFYLSPQFAGYVNITATTVVDNTAASGAGIKWARTILTTISGSVFANNGPECAGTLTSGGYNVAEDTTCPFAQVGDVEGVAVLLGPLADNGGPTRTHLPAAGSPAIDRIPAGTSGLCDATAPVDQRGLPRPAGAGCDSGAVERQPGDP